MLQQFSRQSAFEAAKIADAAAAVALCRMVAEVMPRSLVVAPSCSSSRPLSILIRELATFPLNLVNFAHVFSVWLASRLVDWMMIPRGGSRIAHRARATAADLNLR